MDAGCSCCALHLILKATPTLWAVMLIAKPLREVAVGPVLIES